MEPFVRLKIIRTENRLTQEQVASVLGISRSAYCGYEIGRRKMGTAMIEKLAAFYRLPVSAFFCIEENTLNDGEHYVDDEMYLSSLSDEERDLIVKFRIMTDKEKDMLKNSLNDISKGEK